MPFLSSVRGNFGPQSNKKVSVLDGLTSATAAPSAKFLYNNLGYRTSGNYWIKPIGWSGSPILLFCDMSNQGGGWTLIGKGRQSSDASGGWFGTENELNVLGLQQANSKTAGISKVSSSFVNYLMNGTANGWNNSDANNYMIANRISDATDGYSGVGDSAYMKVTNQTDFRWINQFGRAQTQDSSGNMNGIGNMTAWTGIWLSGSQRPGSFVGGSFADNDFGSGNGTGRWFMWWWSGHGSNHGWSSGSTELRGFQNTSEGHAIQFVQLWAR